jgi:hypothetical protein
MRSATGCETSPGGPIMRKRLAVGANLVGEFGEVIGAFDIGIARVDSGTQGPDDRKHNSKTLPSCQSHPFPSSHPVDAASDQAQAHDHEEATITGRPTMSAVRDSAVTRGGMRHRQRSATGAETQDVDYRACMRVQRIGGRQLPLDVSTVGPV